MINLETKGKLLEYFTNKLRLRPYTRGWLKGNCPNCGRIDKFGINISRNKCNCFVCDYHPSPFSLIMEIEELENFNEVNKFLKVFSGVKYIEPIAERIEQIDLKFPEGYKNLRLGDDFIANQARNYVKSRNFDPMEKSLMGWGYGTKGDYLGYIIIPFYMGGKLVYYNARRFVGNGPKYMNPSIDDFGIGKSMLIYNVDALAIYDHIYLVEGLINADTLGPDSIAAGGKKISWYQLSMMNKSDTSRFTLLLDPDAILDSIRLALKMVYFKQVRVVKLPDGKDVNDLGKEKTLEIVKKVPWMDYGDLLKMKHDEERSKFTYS